jgi:tripartite-type tricarboxylate transporter receptor subunit TctC
LNDLISALVQPAHRRAHLRHARHVGCHRELELHEATAPAISATRRRRRYCSRTIAGENLMKLPRRQFLQLAAGAAVLPGAWRPARAQTYPSRPVRIVVGYAPGGGTDIVARLIGQWLSERLGQQFVIENRPGAGTNIATEAVVRALPDGYTLLLATTANAVNATLYDKLNFNFVVDVAPVAAIMRVPNVMVVNLSSPAKTVPDFIAYAKANPGKINFATGGAGGPDHMSAELFKMMTGISMSHVPYRGLSPALTDLLAGQVDVVFSSFPAAIEYIKSDKLRALAVTTTARFEGAPDIPTIGDVVPGYESSQWYGIGIPKDASAEIVGKLNSEINAALNDPKMKARLVDLGGTPLVGTPADFGKLIAADTEKWGKMIRAANLRAG